MLDFKRIPPEKINIIELQSILNGMALRAGAPSVPAIIIQKINDGRAIYLENFEAFVVIEFKVAANKTVCLVSAAYSKAGDAMRKYSSQISDFTKTIGCEYLEFWTCRTGFERLAPQYGFEKHGVENQFTVWRKYCGR